MNETPRRAADDLSAAWRIVDVGIHRVLEGLRTLDDYARFVLESKALVERLKGLRHQFRTVADRLPAASRLASRSIPRDVGADIGTPSEYDRRSPQDVARAALGRLHESLRSLEEYTKLFSEDVSHGLERLRYEVYELEAALWDPGARRKRLAQASVCLLVDTGRQLDRLVEQARAFVDAGLGMVQLRAKRASDRELLQGARRVRDAFADRTLLIINDRSDVALAADADGVHVGQDDLPLDVARRIVGSSRLVGASTHDDRELAAAAGADYVGFGPVYRSATKTFSEFQGAERVADVGRRWAFPVFAIGGVSPDNIALLAEQGCRHVAVCGAVWTADDPVAVVRALAAALQPNRATEAMERLQ